MVMRSTMIRSPPPINTTTTTTDDDAYAYGGESKLDDYYYYHHHPHYLNRMHSTSNNSTTTHHGMKSPQHQQPATAAVNNSIHWDVEEDHLLYYFLGGGGNDASHDGMKEKDGNAAAELGGGGDDDVDDEEPPVHTPIGIIHIDPISVTSSSSSFSANGGGNAGFHSSASGMMMGSATSMTSIAEECLVAAAGGLPVTSSLESFVHARAQQSPDTLLGPTSPVLMGVAASGGGSSGGNQHPHHSVHFQDEEGGIGQHSQYRRNHNHHHQRTTSSGSIHKVASVNSHSSSSSSLTSMAAALALGGPNQVMYMQQKLQSASGGMHQQQLQYQLNNTSPITPLNMLGLSPSGYEMMMLPPPPRFPNGSTAATTTTNNSSGGGGDSSATSQHTNIQHHGMMQAQQHHQNGNVQQTIPHLAAAVNNALPPNTSQQQHHLPAQPLSEQHPSNFLPQMHQTAGITMASRQQHQQPPYATHSSDPKQHQQHLGFPDPKSIMSAMLSSHHHHHPPPHLPVPPPTRPLSQSLPSQLQSAHHNHGPPPAPPQQLPTTTASTTTQQIQIGLSGNTIPITAISGEDGSIQYQIDPNVLLPNGTLPTTSGLRYFTKAINEVSKPDTQKDIDPEVMAEKRRQRLARNRESARQSRRRKKELLVTLSAKVRKLQGQLEKEVRSKIGSMETELTLVRDVMMKRWLVEQQKMGGPTSTDSIENVSMNIDWERRNTLARILRNVGVNCEIRRTVIAHQYHFLRSAFLSPHNQYAIWMMLQSSKFFTEASRRQQNELALNKGIGGSGSSSTSAAVTSTTTTGNTGNGGPATNKTNTSRANSRQIGENMYNEETAKQQASADASGSYSDENSSTQFGGDASYNDDSKRGGHHQQQCYVACNANDEGKMWPLFCHEIGVTMEQEDRVITQVHTQFRTTPNLHHKLQKMKTAIDATRQLQNAMLCHTQLASQRNEMLLLEILTPTQAALYLDWFKKNKERCMTLMTEHRRAAATTIADPITAGGTMELARCESTLTGVCRQLEDMKLEIANGNVNQSS